VDQPRLGIIAPLRPAAGGEEVRDWYVSISFESDTRPVQTVRLKIAAGNPDGAARKALREARRQCGGPKYRSIVVVLEKEDPATWRPGAEPVAAEVRYDEGTAGRARRQSDAPLTPEPLE